MERRRRGQIPWAALATLTTLAALSTPAVHPLPLAAQDQDPGAREVVSPDSAFALRLPAAFQPMDLHPEATLEFGDTAAAAFLLVLPDPKADLRGWNLTRHTLITLGQLLTSTDFPEVSPPRQAKLDGHPAVQRDIEGVVQGTQIAYLRTTVDLPDQYVQILLWTTGSGKEAQWPRFEEIVGSFRYLGTDP